MKPPVGVCAIATLKSTSVRVHVADTNRLRWVLYALRTNEDLELLVHRPGTIGERVVLILDSLVLGNYASLPDIPCLIVLWDGYVSYVELQRTHDSVLTKARDRCTLLLVGQLKDTLKDLPRNTANLFSDAAKTRQSFGHLSPWHISLGVVAKCWIRPLKNFVASPKRSAALMGRRRIVFCGSIRPTPPAIGSLLSESLGDASGAIAAATAAAPHYSDIGQVKEYGARVFNVIEALNLSNSAEAALAYTLSSLLHRHLTLSHIYNEGAELFVSEYGFDTHIDPYDAQAYRQHLYLDFGSTRGPERLYPRTADLEATRKAYIALRIIDPVSSLERHIRSSSFADLDETAHSHARLAMEQFATRRKGDERSNDVQTS